MKIDVSYGLLEVEEVIPRKEGGIIHHNPNGSMGEYHVVLVISKDEPDFTDKYVLVPLGSISNMVTPVSKFSVIRREDIRAVVVPDDGEEFVPKTELEIVDPDERFY